MFLKEFFLFSTLTLAKIQREAENNWSMKKSARRGHFWGCIFLIWVKKVWPESWAKIAADEPFSSSEGSG